MTVTTTANDQQFATAQNIVCRQGFDQFRDLTIIDFRTTEALDVTEDTVTINVLDANGATMLTLSTATGGITKVSPQGGVVQYQLTADNLAGVSNPSLAKTHWTWVVRDSKTVPVCTGTFTLGDDVTTPAA